MQCVESGKEFVSATGRITCSERKRKRKVRKRLDARAQESKMLTCAFCEKHFVRTAGGQLYCSMGCQKEAKERNRRLNVKKVLDKNGYLCFSTLRTSLSEYPTMDCPECDPMTNRMENDGVWIQTPEQRGQLQKQREQLRKSRRRQSGVVRRKKSDGHQGAATIRTSRLSLGLTQAQAGAVVGVSARTWRGWEAGVRVMPKGMWELWEIKTKREAEGIDNGKKC